MRSAACLSNMKLHTTRQPHANGINIAKEISQPCCTFYNLLCSSPINSYIDFAIKHKLHSYHSLRKKHIDCIGTRYVVKMKCLKHLNVVSSAKVHKSHCLMLWMSGAALNKGKIWHHKPILTQNNSLCFSAPATLEMLSIMVMVVCRCGGENILNIPFRKFLQSHFVKLTTAVFYLAINKAWLLPCPVYF